MSLEYEIVTQKDLASRIEMECQSVVLPYDRIIRNVNRQIPVNKSDTTWSWSFNESCKSSKGILVLFEEEKPYKRDTSNYYSPKIEKVSIIVEVKPNQLYSQGMQSFEQYDEICKYFTEGKQRDSIANEVQKQLQGTIDENVLHGTG